MKVILFLTMLVFSGGTINSALSNPNNTPYSIIEEDALVCSNQQTPDLADILHLVLVEMGMEVNEIIFVEAENMKSCTVRVKGRINGVDIDVTFTVEGKSCAELIKEIMKK